jgi:hypothetical protein
MGIGIAPESQTARYSANPFSSDCLYSPSSRLSIGYRFPSAEGSRSAPSRGVGTCRGRPPTGPETAARIAELYSNSTPHAE